jgi:chromosome segregation ATPase
MYFVLGLLCAGGLVLLLTPAIWRRAQRLTRARVESAVPLSLAEIQAEKDQLRAEFAMGARRLEMTAEKLKAENLDHVVEIARKREEINRLISTHAGANKTIAGLEERVAQLSEALAATENKLAATATELSARDAALSDRVAALASSEENTNRLQQLSDEQKLELVARNTEIDNLRSQIAAAATLERALQGERNGLLADLDAGRATLAAERMRAEGIEAARAALEAERDALLGELAGRLAELKAVEPEMAAVNARNNELLSEIGGMRVEIGGLKAEIDKRGEGHKALETRLAERDSRLVSLETDALAAGNRNAGLATDIESLKAELARERTETSNAREQLSGRVVEIEKRDNWVKSLEADVAVGQARVAELGREIETLKAGRDQQARENDQLKADLANRVAELEQVWTEISRVEGKTAGAEERLTAALAEAARVKAELAQRDAHAADLEKRLTEAMSEIVGIEMKRDQAPTGVPAAGNGSERLAAMQRDVASVRAENEELRRMSGGDLDAIRAENAMLRDRLTGLATDMVRLAEKNGSGRPDPAASSRPATPVIPLPATGTAEPQSDVTVADRPPQSASRH